MCLLTGSQPLSIDVISKFQTLSRSCSLDEDRKTTSKEIVLDNFANGEPEEHVDLNLKESLPQKVYDFNIEIGRYVSRVLHQSEQKKPNGQDFFWANLLLG